MAALCVLLAGCPGRIPDPLAFRAEAAEQCPTGFDVERDLFARTCGTLGCHTGGTAVAAAGLDLSTEGVGDRLMAHVSTECDDRPLIEASDLSGSLLLQKVGDAPPCGDPMPAGLPPLNPTEMACLQQYVADLAGVDVPDAGTRSDAGVPPPVDAGDSPMPDAGPGPMDAGMTGMPVAVTYQAEEMTLSVYEVDALDGTVIRLPDAATTGTARTTFDGVAGTYQLVVHAIAEPDGEPTLTIRVAGADVATVTYPRTASENEPHTIGPYAVTLTPGDELLLEGTVGEGAWARVDRVEVTP